MSEYLWFKYSLQYELYLYLDKYFTLIKELAYRRRCGSLSVCIILLHWLL
jgi:hypothetical protein